MGRWGQLIVVLAFIVLPLVSKALQAIVEQVKANQERKRREQNTHNPASSALISRRDEELQEKQLQAKHRDEDRREELARRRQAQLEAWRARQTGRTMPTPPTPGVQNRVGATSSTSVQNNILTPQSGDQLIRDMLAQRAQQVRQTQQQQQSQTARQQSSLQQANQQKRTAKRRHLHNPNDNEVHRLVLSDEEKRSLVKTPSGRSPVESGPDNSSAPITSPSAIRSIMLSHDTLRNAFILKELLDKPLALRD